MQRREGKNPKVGGFFGKNQPKSVLSLENLEGG
jgi:hypothetical protein